MQSGFRDFLKTNKNCRQDFQDFVYNEQTNDARIFKDLKNIAKGTTDPGVDCFDQ